MATAETKDKDAADYAAQFNTDAPAPREQSDDEAFGLADAPGSNDGGPGAGGENAATEAGGEAANAPDPKAQEAEAARLRDLEASLQARADELAAKEAAMATSNTNETQTSTAGGENASTEAGGADEEGDPEKALEEDFGPEFVGLLKRLFKKWCGDEVKSGMGPLAAQVNDVIEHLRAANTANHFKAIAAAHADYEEIVQSQEFGAWKAEQSPEEQQRLQRVIEAGSTDEIIAMLTAFKNSRKSSSVDEAALDEAEGVRSSGLSLPKPPAAADDFAASWNAS